MTFIKHIKLLMIKNFIIIRRSKLWLFFELFFGLLLIPLFLFIVYKSQTEVIDGREFSPVQITGDSEDLSRPVPNIQRISTRMCNSNKTLGFVSPNDIGDKIMEKFEQKYRIYTYSIFTEKFDSLDAMKKKLNDDLNSTASKLCGHYMGGIHIKKLDVENKIFDYQMYIRDREGSQWHIDQFWPDDGPYGALADLNSIPSKPNYWSTGFLSFKHSIDSLFLQEVGRNLTDFNLYLARLPTPKFRNNGLLAVLKAMPILFIISVLGIMIHTVKEVVAEKEVGIKTHLIVMGLDSTAFYFSHFIVAFLKLLIIMGSISVILSFGFVSISPFVFIPFCLLFGVAAIVFSLLISVLFRKTSFAVATVIFLWFGLYGLDSYWKLFPTKIGISTLQSLNVFTAFHLGLLAMGRYESRLLELNLWNIFAESVTTFSIGYAFLMLSFDIFIMCVLICYLDAVWPTDDSPKKHPLYFLPFFKEDNIADHVNLENNDNDFTDNYEADNTKNSDVADISIQNMSKIWENGQIAVDGLSLNAYRGQVTVLLGHNGAGKSTTFSVISGISSSTKGDVIICNKSISSKITECQKEIGFCPQYNPLFDKLTVKEHLRLYGKLKNDKWNAQSEEVMNRLIEMNQLTHKANELACNLSGGMKRKLCFSMALIGDSKVILLDEPTAGMDPEARHEICKILENEKKNRTILLTTHYMDEADLLGDQIAIMVKGRLVCKGSSHFLKNRFGTGYILTMVINLPNEKYTEQELNLIRNNILATIRKHSPNIIIEKYAGLQFSIILPTNDKQHFGNLFEELEQEKINLKISSFGLSHNTLEQVFLKVGEMAETQEDEIDGNTVINNACKLFEQIEVVNTKGQFILQRILTVVYRYMINAYRNKIRTLLPLMLAILLFSLISFLSSSSNYVQQKDLSLNELEPVTIPILLNQQKQIIADFPFIAGKLKDSVILNIPPQSDFKDTIIKHSYDSPALGIGAVVKENGTVYAYFNGAAYHGPALVMSFVSNAILQENKDSIKTSIEVYASESYDEQAETTIASAFTNILNILCFSFLTSMFVMPIVEDRVSRFKHQLLLTKLDKILYWIGVTIWNAVIYVAFCLILTTIMFLSGNIDSCIIINFLFWFLYFWSAVPFVYVTSFIFKSPFKAFVALLSWNIIVALIATTTMTIFMALGSADIADYLVVIFSLFLPSFALGRAVLEVSMQCPIMGEIIKWETLNKVIICMVISGLVFWIILIFIEKTFPNIMHAILNKLHGGYNQIDQIEENEDEDVQAERHRLTNTSDNDLALSVRDVSKYYGNNCALRKLSIGVNPNDCFGLLGVNGAGKTTTFNILTGKTFPTRGRAFVSGIDIKNTPIIGYCPQFDALALDLTGRQTLTLLGRLNGFNDVNKRVECVLESIQMSEQADKLVMHYSGGQKRRLSIGVTLMSNASLIMLDEPTAGIDPKTRRHIWNLLSAIRDKKIAILLTSHSMDECEALCSRIGFLNKGSLISIGTSQHLKSRYGNSFLLTFTVDNPSIKIKAILDQIVTSTFNALPTPDLEHRNNYHWEIPRKGNDSWSKLYKKAQEIAKKYQDRSNITDEPVINDFSITQNSLEQVFLRLTKYGASNDNTESYNHV